MTGPSNKSGKMAVNKTATYSPTPGAPLHAASGPYSGPSQMSGGSLGKDEKGTNADRAKSA